MSAVLTRRGLVQGGAVVLGAAVAGIPASARPGPAAPSMRFDAEAFVTDLLAAGCHLSVHQPVGRDAGPAYVWVEPTIPDGTPTVSEREVRARWEAALAACPDADARILAVCQQRAEQHRVRRLGEAGT